VLPVRVRGLLEPEEGKYDFSPGRWLHSEAPGRNHQHLGWCGSQAEERLSIYSPEWVMKDVKRFPRACSRTAHLLQYSPHRRLRDTTRGNADCPRLAALMRHVKEVDSRTRSHLVQVENESGMAGGLPRLLGRPDTAFAGSVPRELMSYMQEHKRHSDPEFRRCGSWAASRPPAPGKKYSRQPREPMRFRSLALRTLRGKVAAAGKAEYPIPMYVQRGDPPIHFPRRRVG